jgi:hypothetical protein
MRKTNADKTGKTLGSITIEGRYNGPPNVANGGYVCGILAKFIEGTADIWIRRRTPLDQELSMVEYEDGTLCILFNSEVVVEGKPGNLDLDMPESPSFAQATESAKKSRAIQMNEFNDRKFLGIHPTCFCCGAERTDGHGLKIHPGRVPGKDIIAAPWIPGDDLADEDGQVRPEFIWTALDCPGAFAAMDLGNGHPGLLGRLIGQVLLPIQAKEPCVVVARAVSTQGRKHFAGTAVYNSKGQLAGKALATWIGRT